MAENSKIEWTTHTFNPWTGCTKVSPGCKYCYAEALMDKRYHKVVWGPQGTRLRTSEANWRKPLQWNNTRWERCVDCGWEGPVSETHVDCPQCDGEDLVPARQRVFVASLADVGEIHPTILPEWRRDLVNLVAQCTNLDWLFLTKRPENFNELYLELFGGKLPDNLWVGTSVEDQKYADLRIPKLADIPARITFLSVEPLIERVDLKSWINPRSFSDINDLGPWEHQEAKEIFGLVENSLEPFKVNWVIVGGESGFSARPMHPEWVTSIRDECVSAGVPFHFKQWGEWKAAETLLEGIEFIKQSRGNMCQVKGDALLLHRIGKHAAGRILDGRTWDEYPGS